uniref:tryptophan halogenase family protein n=1 Tax=Ningiella ruwaisensis TaxID=2364274 RepID=UPI00109F05D4|nr:tryptophan halogenase family protein [Ningiella ruwaisensis]
MEHHISSNHTQEQQIKRIVILGGGSAGWMSAATLARQISTQYCNIILIESEDIGTVSVGEATIPQILQFNRVLGIDENEFLRETKATFKLGIRFKNWGQIGDDYIHPFGNPGTTIGPLSFYQYWLKNREVSKLKPLEYYSIEARAAREGKFMRPANLPNSPLGSIAYAYHFDATLYAKYLRKFSLSLGARRIEGKVKQVKKNKQTGFVESLILENGQQVNGDLFIDCSGFNGLLIDKTMDAHYEDWRHWLPCDSAVVAPCHIKSDVNAHTTSTAHSAGWQWRIPLQHRVGNGCVYSSKFMTRDEAVHNLVSTMESEPLAEPRDLKWVTGCRKTPWVKNVVAIGLSAGFVEPLESTGLHTIQNAISKLLVMFPTKQFKQSDIDAYNKVSYAEFARLRDFIILHYKATQREDSEFWQYCKNMTIPDTLQEKFDLFQNNGRFWRQDSELFGETSWISVFLGQNIYPDAPHPLADIMPEEKRIDEIRHIEKVLENALPKIPNHFEYLEKYCLNN